MGKRLGRAGLRLVLAGAVVLGAVPLVRAQVSGAGETIPAVHGTTLTGEAVELPPMPAGRAGVLVLGFSRGAREPVAAWGRRLAADYKTSSTVVYYEMPMLASVPRLMRGMVIRSMKKDVPARAQPRFVPLTDDEDRWKSLVGYSKDKDDDAYVLIVDGKGRVFGREHGAVTEALFAQVKAAIEAANRGAGAGPR